LGEKKEGKDKYGKDFSHVSGSTTKKRHFYLQNFKKTIERGKQRLAGLNVLFCLQKMKI